MILLSWMLQIYANNTRYLLPLRCYIKLLEICLKKMLSTFMSLEFLFNLNPSSVGVSIELQFFISNVSHISIAYFFYVMNIDDDDCTTSMLIK